MKNPRKLIARAVVVSLAISAVALVLIGVECATRILFKRLDPLAVFVTVSGGAPKDQPMVFDPKRFWKLAASVTDQNFSGTTVTSNSVGIRWDKEFEKKDAFTIRIITVGDSFTFGSGVANDPERGVVNFTANLQHDLAERHSDWKWEVIPLACPGYTTAQGRFWLEDTIETLEPDLVVPCFGWTDASPTVRTNNQVGMYSKSAQRVRCLSEHSQAVTRFLKWRGGKHDAESEPPNRLPRTALEDFIFDHEAMWRIAARHSAETLVILPLISALDEPFTNDCVTLYRNKLAEFCRSRQIPTLHIPELTETAAPGNFEYFTHDKIHPNAAGHRLIAERLYPAIVPAIDRITAARRTANAKLAGK